MSKKNYSVSKIIFLVSGITLMIVAFLFWWNQYNSPAKVVRAIESKNLDSLYHVTYGSMRVDDNAGNAYLEDIHIVPDTSLIRFIPSEYWPPAILDISIKSISIKGANAAEAIKGARIVGDTVIINRPEIRMYTLRPLQRNTKIESEARLVFREMLGRLKLIEIGYILIDSINVKSVGFRSGENDFDFLNGNIQISDVLVDSTHHTDNSRVLFSRNASFHVDSFLSYNHSRPEFLIKDVVFNSRERSVKFGKIMLNRFNDENGRGQLLIDATSLKVAGLNTNEIIENKNLAIDSVQCGEIKFYEPPEESLTGIGKTVGAVPANMDSLSGFRNVYGLTLQYFGFENVKFVPIQKDRFDIGKVSLRLQRIEASRISEFERNPLRFIHEANLDITFVKLTSKDSMYNFNLNDIKINSLEKKLYMGEIVTKPVAGEEAFAHRYPYQKDRFDISMKDVTVDGIGMENLFDHKFFASQITVGNTIARIYRDLNKPVEPVSRVGGYPSQLLKKIDFPINISKAVLPVLFLEYREKQALNNRTGTIRFYNTHLELTNITNINSGNKENNSMDATFQTSVLNSIPLKGTFRFFPGDENGAFEFRGEAGSFNAVSFNPISVPMALVKVKTGHISEISFDLRGDNFRASGPFSMKYENLKIEVLKKDVFADTVRKRGLASLLANIIVKNSNPLNGEFRKVTAMHERNIHKSFFNLVWKTVFNGIKSTVGIPQ